MGNGTLRCSLSLSLIDLPDSLMYSSVDVCTLKPVYVPTFLKFVVSVLGGHEKGFNGVTPFELYLNPQGIAYPFVHFPKSGHVWYNCGDVFAVWSIVVGLVGLVGSGCLSIICVCLWLNLYCKLLRAHGGKLQVCRTFLMCSISWCSASWLVQTTLAQNTKVLKTLYLAMMKWLLSQCRYWLVCVGFL